MAENQLTESQKTFPTKTPKKVPKMSQRLKTIKENYEKYGILPTLTKKRRAWLALYLNIDDKKHFFNALQCTYTIFNVTSFDSASRMASEYSQILAPWIDQFLEELCFTDSAIKAKVYQLMHARETKFAIHKGEFTDQREVEALSIQLKAADLASELKGMKKKTEDKPVAIFNLNFGGNMAFQIGKSNVPVSDD